MDRRFLKASQANSGRPAGRPRNLGGAYVTPIQTGVVVPQRSFQKKKFKAKFPNDEAKHVEFRMAGGEASVQMGSTAHFVLVFCTVCGVASELMRVRVRAQGYYKWLRTLRILSVPSSGWLRRLRSR
jgi:hypothetical protein